MVNDKLINLDLGADFEEGSYKSCFARSVAVNSQYSKISKEPDTRQPLTKPSEGNHVVGRVDCPPPQEGFRRLPARPLSSVEALIEPNEIVKLRKGCRSNSMDEPMSIRRLSCSSASSSRRTSICSSRIAEIPVENIVQQTKVETLQWQLKETEKSREMYKALMKQVVTFLERAHRNLELLGSRMNAKNTVPRSKSEHQIVTEEADLINLNGSADDYTSFRDFTWRRPKKPELAPEEVPPEKLSQEAFRLLRTAQSLLNTQEPKLTPVSSDEPEDIEFLAQLAKEFPQTPEIVKPQRTTSFSLSPKLILPENETKISTAFNRKLSLQLNDSRRNSYKDILTPPRITGHHLDKDVLLPIRNNQESPRISSVFENETNFLSSTMTEIVKTSNEKQPRFKRDLEKSNSPPAGSISSVDDESGFSSMNSFQDVGLPSINDEVTTKNALLRSMLHNMDSPLENPQIDVKLWQKPESNLQMSHKRWNSTPVDCTPPEATTKQSMKVLWV